MNTLDQAQSFGGILLLILFTSCDNNPTEPQDKPVLRIADVTNIVWTLEGYEIAGEDIDLSSYELFHLIYDPEAYVGDDGCNKYGGTYEIKGDSVLPKSGWITLLNCDTNNFSFQHLTEPYKVRIDSNELMINRDDAAYTYRSNFMNSIANSPLANKTWELIFSNDPEFELLKLQNNSPKLILNMDRSFKINWFCVDNIFFECNEIIGVFGTGKSESILFYRRGSSIAGDIGLRFVAKILSSSSYGVHNDILTLFNKSDSTTFEFALERRYSLI
jgi:heat shock protein HslJ